jgi:hypothetical protein
MKGELYMDKTVISFEDWIKKMAEIREKDARKEEEAARQQATDDFIRLAAQAFRS